MNITDFLLARIAEDEALILEEVELGETFSIPPRRVLAECEAKRRIVEAHRTQVEDDDPHAWIVGSGVLLKALALPYADHPDYRAEWRP